MTDKPSLSTIVAGNVALRSTETAGVFLGCCPFHTEKTPSFVVDDVAGRFRCYSCRIDGDASDFAARWGKQ